MVELLILKRTGVDDVSPIARWSDDEGWIAGDEERYPFIGNTYFDRYNHERMLGHFDGPDYFAIRAENYTGEGGDV